MRVLALVLFTLASAVGALADISSIISRDLFNEMLKHRNDAACPAKGFYTYDAFIAAANSFGAFGTTGDIDTKKREIAAFLAQTSHETTGGWATAPDGPYAWGYCYVKEQGNPGDYCVQSQQWPCAPGKKYYGRGPIQISYCLDKEMILEDLEMTSHIEGAIFQLLTLDLDFDSAAITTTVQREKLLTITC
ncbi:hypothetical protein SLEP1_g52270 [Rubroshorea leprosula]|uniref:Glycoside hydrolase family 19 catalytic domain-containing protein n=1 Tax=Rubroshorea leprosula TaxID=152421 RepID=A0AAV5M5T1_9ROSI|nr:hypothetical protein SLEP1_g52270 [Rubroshorea leprosula]